MSIHLSLVFSRIVSTFVSSTDEPNSLMKNYVHIYLLVVMQLIVSAADAQGVSFFEGDIRSLKIRARQVNKPILLTFVMHPSQPCEELLTNTFRDPEVAAYLNEQFLVYPVDIAHERGVGANMVNQYGITLYPTFIVLDSQGAIIDKYAGAITAKRLLAYLQKQVQIIQEFGLDASSPLIMSFDPIQSPSPVPSPDEGREAAQRYEEINEYSREEDGVIYSPYEPSSRPGNASTYATESSAGSVQIIDQADTRLAERDAAPRVEDLNEPKAQARKWPFAQSSTADEPTRPLAAPIASEPAEATAFHSEGLFNVDVKPQVKEGFGLQLGAYYDYDNMLRAVQRLKHEGHPEVLVRVQKLMGRSTFKVLVGPFKEKVEANRYQEALIRRHPEYDDAFVVDLSKF